MAFLFVPVPADMAFDWATTGNPGNAFDQSRFGAVDNTYRVSNHEANMSSDARGGIIESRAAIARVPAAACLPLPGIAGADKPPLAPDQSLAT